MRTAQVFASAVPLAVLEPWATAAVAWDAALVGRASPNVLLTRLRPGTEETLHGFWTPGYGCVVVDKAVIARCDALLVMAGLDGDGLDGLDGLAPVANALKIDCAVSAVPLSAAAVTHLLTEAPATWATVGNTHRKLQICSLSRNVWSLLVRVLVLVMAVLRAPAMLCLRRLLLGGGWSHSQVSKHVSRL